MLIGGQIGESFGHDMMICPLYTEMTNIDDLTLRSCPSTLGLASPIALRRREFTDRSTGSPYGVLMIYEGLSPKRAQRGPGWRRCTGCVSAR
jgi:hypothetical protein